jgi:hypothetical protein
MQLWLSLLNMERLNSKQEFYIKQLVSMKPSILKHCDPYKLNYEAQLALLILDGEGWLYDDMVQAIKNYFVQVKKTLGDKKNAWR